MQPRGLVVSFNQAALFPSGEDVISPDAYNGLEKVAAAINKIPNPVRLEGHTDSVPIRTARFHSNWELSAARSIALLELLSTRFGVSRQRMSIAGYADSAPVASNETEEGRAHNRRADIVILNEQGVIGEPAKGPEPAP
jgi:chemotaxis protein MotB